MSDGALFPRGPRLSSAFGAASLGAGLFGAGLFSAALTASLVFISRSAAAETIWDRAREVAAPSGRRTVAALERVLSGWGTPDDQFVVRVALVSFSRGEITEPRAVVLLSRLRRQLGLATMKGAEHRLKLALAGELSASHRAWAYEELFYLARGRGDTGAAEAELNRALHVAWQAETRARLHVLRGYNQVFRGSLERVSMDFHLARELSGPGALEVRALLGLGLIALLQGRRADLTRYVEAADRANRRRAAVSGADDFKDLALAPEELQLLKDLLLLGRAGTRAQEFGEEGAVLLYRELCEGPSARDSSSAERGPLLGFARSQLSALCGELNLPEDVSPSTLAPPQRP